MQQNIKLEGDLLFTPPSSAQQIKFICRQRKEELNISSRQISVGIMEKFNVAIPATTIANFFSDKTKAPSVYTAGYICSYLGISLDEAFLITSPKTPVEAALQERIMAQDKELIYHEEHFKQASLIIRRQWKVIATLAISTLALAAMVLFFLFF